ncbi:zinc ribbon protein [Dysgonomonas alginatilytica]|uniref:Zinc ribbon protein n=1 Tax=Dysgonomonas alginatilytica TaxID=1605892 RepID=A0A2V3PL18_9BACT|nr:zinc-ribbon domain-containing protein [Dysgonomonas alginatilytica]PXV60162.1 zinc ribbon protein [Dysgonomonas alginatilytica]
MALIKCPDCGREFSETANTCPQCGYRKRSEEIKQKTNSGIKKVGAILLILILTVAVQFILIEIIGVQYPKGTNIFFSMGIAAVLSLGAKALGLFDNEE